MPRKMRNWLWLGAFWGLVFGAWGTPDLVVLFDGKSADAFFPKQWVFVDGVLRGEGMLRTKKRYNNFEVRLRYRQLEKHAPVRFGPATVAESPRGKVGGAVAAAQVGRWRNLHVLVRGMPDEQVMVANLTPLEGQSALVSYGGKQIRFAARNDRKSYKLREDGFVPDGGRMDVFFDAPVEIGYLAVAPLSPTSPREQQTLSGAALTTAVAKGEAIYKVNCVTCHGDGVGKAPNPLARSFATDALANGSDLQSIWRTLTDGFRNMPPMASLSVEERYQVGHYLRERILKQHNPNAYKAIDPRSLENYNHPLYMLREEAERAAKSPEMVAKEVGRFRDHGPVLVTTNKGKRNALQVKLAGETTISYNLHAMASLGVWQGSFMEMLGSHFYVGKGHRQPTANGIEVPELSTWKWAHGGELNYREQPDNGPMSTPGFRFNGYYLHNDRVVLDYQLENRLIREMPEVVVEGETRVLVQHLEVAPGKQPVTVAVSEHAIVDGLPPKPDGVVVGSENWQLALVGELESVRWGNVDGMFSVTVAPTDKVVRMAVVRAVGKQANATVRDLAGRLEVAEFANLTRGGERRWPETYVAAGEVAAADAAYVVDTLPVPFENDYNAWMRTTALAFFPDGRAAVTTYDGDVWIVSGIDQELKAVTWSRFAAGLHEAFGCQIVDGQIYVGTRNGIVRLHDLNADGEADYYEQFFADPDFSYNYHGYNFDLVRDDAGNFYYVKNGQFTDIAYDGGCLKIAPDGKSSELIATGFRTPNGMGILPDGRLLFGDNQGSWVPAGKLSIIEKGKWYGGSTRGLKNPPKTFEKPFLWLPQEVDNSCGGQVWVADDRFGPLGAGRLFHTSCGSGRAMMVYLDEFGGTAQGAVWRFPQKFDSGIMRPRVNPADGQVYVTGTRGWGVKAPKDGCLQRVRYTGKAAPVLVDVRARRGRIILSFSESLPDEAIDAAGFEVHQWNYRWSRTYGSAKYSLIDPEVTKPDRLMIDGIQRGGDGRQLVILVPSLGPADQVRLGYRVPGSDQAQEVHLTIHALAETQAANKRGE